MKPKGKLNKPITTESVMGLIAIVIGVIFMVLFTMQWVAASDNAIVAAFWGSQSMLGFMASCAFILFGVKEIVKS